MVSENRVDQPEEASTQQPFIPKASTSPPPPSLSLQSLGRLQSREVGSNSKDHPHAGQGATACQLGYSQSHPQSSPAGLESGPTRKEPPAPVPADLPHMPTWAWEFPSRVGWVGVAPSAPAGGRPRGRAGARGSGGLCGAACSATPPPADGCRLQQRRQRRRRLGVRRGLGTVPTAPGPAPDARPAPAPARPPRPAQRRLPRACLLPGAALPLPPPPLCLSLSPSLFLYRSGSQATSSQGCHRGSSRTAADGASEVNS